MSRRLGLGIAGLAVAAALYVVLGSSGPDAPARTGNGPASVGEAAATRAAVPIDHTIETSGTLRLRVAELPRDRPLRLALDLEVPSANGEPRPIRLIAPDGRLLHLEGVLDEATRTKASLGIEPGWLEPGRTIVEVKTTERTHFPLRRYVLEVE